MNWFKSGDLLDRAFAVGIILKGLDGVLEVVGGVLLLVVSPTTIDQLSRALTQHVVKIVLVAALLRDKIWAYPWMIAFLIVFIVYQIYRLTFAFSIGLVALTVFDLVVVWLTYREYGKQRTAPNPRDSIRTSAP